LEKGAHKIPNILGAEQQENLQDDLA
jgi:hypothetical protein